MDKLNKTLIKILSEKIAEHPEKEQRIDTEWYFSQFIPELAEICKNSVMNSARDTLIERRKLSREFEQRNIDRWGKGFDLLETQIILCTDVGNEFNNSYRREYTESNNLVFDLVVRHHARACHIAQEILCLLKCGYADAAHARWRVLHEVNATAMFINKHGQECAERFYWHNVVDSYTGMLEHKEYEGRLQEKAPPQEEIDKCKNHYDSLIKKYGATYGDHYGWASYIFNNRKRVTFTAIEKDVGLDHTRPYYRWASQNIHAGSKGMRNRLGLCETEKDILLVGQSNSGMIDPAVATALSLYQITYTLTIINPTLDTLVMMKVIEDYLHETEKAFVEINSEILASHEQDDLR